MTFVPSRVLLLMLAFAGFVSLGLPDAVLGIAWPSLRREFLLTQAALGWILLAGSSGYFTSGLFAGRLMARAGVGSLLFGSTVLVVAGVLGYTFAPSVLLFALAAIVVGWGSGAIDAGLNAHAARHFRPGHMAWLHAAYSAGAALGSVMMARAVTSSAGVRAGYAAVAALLVALSVAFFLTRRFWSENDATANRSPSEGSVASIGAREALRKRTVKLGALSFFVYSGVELGAGHWAYTILVQSRNVSEDVAGLVVSAYWASLFVGRVASGFLVERVGNVGIVRYATGLALLGAAAFAVSALPGLVSAAGLVLVGFAIAPIYPALMSETPRRTRDAAGHAIGFQVSAAIAGAVTLPALGGLLAEWIGLEATAGLVAACAATLLVLAEALTHAAEIRRR
ncbi:MAG TPA: MFS transporter [Polyangiaceae bacterium]